MIKMVDDSDDSYNVIRVFIDLDIVDSFEVKNARINLY